MNPLLTLHDPETARHYYIDGIWQRDTLYSLLRDHALRRPNAFALRDGRRRLTWATLLEWVETLAAELDELGVRRGQRVSVWLPNRAEALVVFLACSRNGYVCNPSLHQNYTVAEILTLLERIQTTVLFAQTGYGADAQRADVFAAAAALPRMKRVYRLDPPDALSAGAISDGTVPFPPPDPCRQPVASPETNPDKVVYLAFTSGTTGMPKGVMHSDNTLLANGRAMVADWHHDVATILLSLSSMSHHIGTVAIEQMLVAGLELVVNDPPPGMTPLDWILETGATYVMGVPTHAMDVIAEMTRRSMWRLGSVKTFYMAGSPIPRETAQAFLDRGIMPQNIYGMTENGSHQYTLPTDDARTIVETCGRACRGYEIRIWDAENPDIEGAAGAVGEIGGRGGCLMLGYFDNQTATEESFNSHGWFMSGDLGRLNGQGCLQIVGRKKDVIIRGGHNIYPARIEDLAMKISGVTRAAAFPVPDGRLGEKVCLAVVPAGGIVIDPQELLHRLHAAGLSKYDMPEYFVALDSFPMTASGKVLKRELVVWVESARIAPIPVRWTDRVAARDA